MEGLGVYCCGLALSPSADARLFCGGADAALWAEDYCDSFKDVQTIGVVFGAFFRADTALQQSVSITAAVQKCFPYTIMPVFKLYLSSDKFSIWEAYQTDSAAIIASI